ncbi:hypothetical protein ACI2IX_06165 [Leifsonia aquatica]|uniref:hypothetical protein n=1 Tax=Leifsonia aquatica TaxID=144185 RepID=UPI00384D2D37
MTRMARRKKSKKQTIADANRTYFGVLAITRGSMGGLSALAVLVLFFVGLESFVFFDPSRYQGNGLVAGFSAVNRVMIWVSALVLILSMFRSLIYRFQVLFSVVMAGMATFLVYALCFGMVPLITSVMVAGTLHFLRYLDLASAIVAVLLVGSVVAHVLLLRRRLRVGHSEYRTIGNFVAASASNRSKTFWITSAAVALVPNVLTAGEYFLNSFGVVAVILFACVTPSLPVELAYLAYLKSKDRAYWEGRPRPTPRTERLRVARKVGYWVFGILALWGLIWGSGKLVTMSM